MKKQKIVLTGSLGYLGTELCKLYSGEARYKDIICIDNRFISQRVTQLRQWGMTFIQGSILDKDLMQKHLHDADIVYHLAGITDVAYVATQANDTQDKLIREVGSIGTRNVLDTISKSCKLIFPSSHVVFEGLTETKFDIDEMFQKSPILSYAMSKHGSEMDIHAKWNNIHQDNHIIVRLGSVYGYSTDTMRINIMPNLFSKIASQDGTISLFSGGKQWKSLVNVIDVVRAMKFLAESDHTGTYHLSNENMTIRQVAEICQSINPKVTLIYTADVVPNLGYTLSNNKLLSTGFKFLYNIKDSIQEMISKWSYHNTDTPLEYIQTGGNEYIDERGIIRNYELTEPINLIGYIFSRAGTVRANHYHPIQEQKCLLLSGRYVSVIKDLSYPDAPLEYKVIHPGDIAVIRPNVAHTMVFLQDSTFLNLVNGEREHANYGITHTIPYKLVDDTMRDNIVEQYRVDYKTECRVCGSRRLSQVLSLGESPLANNLLNSPNDYCAMYPLELMYCRDCYNVQLSVVVPATKMFDNYLYVSSTSQVFRKHFEDAAVKYINEFGLTSNSIVWDIGSNDGIFLKPLQIRGIKVCGIEPAENLCTLANDNGITTIHGYFNDDTSTRAYQLVGSPDIITASNVFAHADDLVSITKTVFNNLKSGGVFIIEVQYLIDTIRDLTFDNIYHEHVNYWSVHALNTMMTSLGNTLFHVEHIDTHGGSIRCYISKDRQVMPSVQEFITTESGFGIHDIGMFIQFRQRVEQIKNNVRINMRTIKHLFSAIVGYGSPAKATTALNYFGIDNIMINCTIDDNILKQGKYIPGTGIQIVNGISHVDLYIVLAWNFFDSIKAKLDNQLCISIKDLQLDNISFASLLSDRYTIPTQIGELNRYIIDYKDFAFNLLVGDYWGNYYKQKVISIIPDCYNSIIECIRTIDKSKYIVDIGANCGIISIPVAKLGYKVLAFDPVIANIETIKAAIIENNIDNNLKTFQYALSNINELTEVYIPECFDNAAMNSTIAVCNMSSKLFNIQEVEAITFDTWLSNHPQYRNVGFVKIDVQGYEAQVIKGMDDFLKNCRDIYIICEFDESVDGNLEELYDMIIVYGFQELKPITNGDKLFYKS